MKEAMQKNRRMTEEEFTEIVTIMAEVPRKTKEKQRDYFERLKRYGVTRSRFTLQMVEAVIKEEPKDMGAAFDIYKKKMTATNNKKENNQEPKEENQIPGQIEMDMTQQSQEKPELSDQVKMMRFQAHEADLIIRSIEETGVMVRMMLDKLNDTMCMILRAVRKE